MANNHKRYARAKLATTWQDIAKQPVIATGADGKPTASAVKRETNKDTRTTIKTSTPADVNAYNGLVAKAILSFAADGGIMVSNARAVAGSGAVNAFVQVVRLDKVKTPDGIETVESVALALPINGGKYAPARVDMGEVLASDSDKAAGRAVKYTDKYGITRTLKTTSTGKIVHRRVSLATWFNDEVKDFITAIIVKALDAARATDYYDPNVTINSYAVRVIAADLAK